MVSSPSFYLHTIVAITKRNDPSNLPLGLLLAFFCEMWQCGFLKGTGQPSDRMRSKWTLLFLWTPMGAFQLEALQTSYINDCFLQRTLSGFYWNLWANSARLPFASFCHSSEVLMQHISTYTIFGDSHSNLPCVALGLNKANQGCKRIGEHGIKIWVEGTKPMLWVCHPWLVEITGPSQ